MDLIPSSVDPTPPLMGELDTTQVFLISSNHPKQGDILLVLTKSYSGTEVIPFDWDSLVKPHLLSSIHFQIIMQVADKYIYRTNLD